MMAAPAGKPVVGVGAVTAAIIRPSRAMATIRTYSRFVAPPRPQHEDLRGRRKRRLGILNGLPLCGHPRQRAREAPGRQIFAHSEPRESCGSIRVSPPTELHPLPTELALPTEFHSSRPSFTPSGPIFTSRGRAEVLRDRLKLLRGDLHSLRPRGGLPRPSVTLSRARVTSAQASGSLTRASVVRSDWRRSEPALARVRLGGRRGPQRFARDGAPQRRDVTEFYAAAKRRKRVVRRLLAEDGGVPYEEDR